MARRSSPSSRACRPGSTIDFDAITHELRRRQGGYGRGRRMAIESDRAEILSGVRRGRTTGAPVALLDRATRIGTTGRTRCTSRPRRRRARPAPNRAAVVRPRPGHADLAGALKYDHDDIRDVLERASARETAARVAAGAIARQLLQRVGVRDHQPRHRHRRASRCRRHAGHLRAGRAVAAGVAAALRRHRRSRQQMIARDRCAPSEAGDTLGGAFEVIARGVPLGLGSYVQWDRKLDGRLAQALMSIPAIKAVGDRRRRRRRARRPGSQVHDEIVAGPAAAGRAGVAPAHQSRRRPRRRRHQRRGAARHRLHEADLDADEAAALGRPHHPRRGARGDRAQRRVRRAGRRGGRRGDGRPGARRRPARALRRRLDAIEVLAQRASTAHRRSAASAAAPSRPPRRRPRPDPCSDRSSGSGIPSCSDPARRWTRSRPRSRR